MTTCREILTFALKQARAINMGEDLSAEELTDGMTALQSMFDEWVANGMFGQLTDVYTTADYTANEGERVVAPAGVTVTIPTTISDCDGTRAPRDLSLIETSINGTRQVSLYDRDAWVRIEALTADTACPLARRGVAGLAACVATTFTEMFGGELGPATLRQGLTFKGSVARKFGSTHDKLGAEYF
jgi:hypothetical protein